MILPRPRLIDPASVPALRWGVVGAGRIAGLFVQAATRHTTQRIVAVAARDSSRSQAFAAMYGIATVHPSVDALLADAGIDVVYIATPHSAHHDLALAAIAAGKHVLIEKPIAVSSVQAAQIAAAAAAVGVLVMEAMWTRYLPQHDVLRQLVADGALGEVSEVRADFGAAAPYDPAGRLWNPDLAGGALLDLGVYPIAFASGILGTPSRVLASGTKTAAGVDLRSAAILTSPIGADAYVSSSIVSDQPTRATVIGATARVELARPWYAPTKLRLVSRGDGRSTTEVWTDDTFGDSYAGLSYEATALAAYVGQGRLESPVHTLAETTAVLATIESIHAQLTVVDWPPSA